MTIIGSPLRKCGIQQTAQRLIESRDLYECPSGVGGIYTLNNDGR